MTRIAVRLLGAAMLLASACTAAPAAELEAILVIDGDTVEKSGVRYRLTGFDAPEIERAKCLQERQLGIVTAAWLIELIAKRGAELDAQVGPGAKPRRDMYGRVLARLRLGGEEWADIAIRQGHGVAYDGRGPRREWCPKQ
jgi:endonuclease YncB( thermonuclease family)